MIDLKVDDCLGLNQVATITDSFTDRSIVGNGITTDQLDSVRYEIASLNRSPIRRAKNGKLFLNDLGAHVETILSESETGQVWFSDLFEEVKQSIEDNGQDPDVLIQDYLDEYEIEEKGMPTYPLSWAIHRIIRMLDIRDWVIPTYRAEFGREHRKPDYLDISGVELTKLGKVLLALYYSNKSKIVVK